LIVSGNKSTEIEIEGRKLIYFGGTNYLGMAHRKELLDAVNSAFERFGLSAGASRVTSGEHELLTDLEREIAAFCSAEAAIVMPAGFMANTAAAESIEEDVDAWLVDERAHASILQAVLKTGKEVIVYQTQLLDRAFRERVGRAKGRLGVFCETVNILTGQVTDLERIVNFVVPDDVIIIDEAHSLGVLGDTGGGIVTMRPSLRWPANLIRTGTFSKAFGSFGGFAVSSRAMIDQFHAKAPSLKGSTPLPPALCAASLKALEVARKELSLFDRLRGNIDLVNRKLIGLGFENFRDHQVPIFCLPDSPALQAIQADLKESRLFIPSMSKYTIRPGVEIGLRWTVQSGHTQEHFDELFGLLDKRLAGAAKV
jgi:7-keto-8-aminopelargonate synthetase and related enzymes